MQLVNPFIQISTLTIQRMKTFLVFLTTCLTLYFSPVYAGTYTPEGLKNVTTHKLDNGLQIYLRERHEARSTSIRLVVNYGSDDNECGKTETAHYLEHLLFTGTSKHSEDELSKLIEDNGGSWNAYTYDEKTTYDIDIYSPYTELALDVLHEIITDSTLTDDNVKKTLDIINREAGGKNSWLSRFLYTLDIGKTGYDKGNEVMYAEDEICPIIESFEDISRDDIIAAFNKFYVPNNMALILVGDFDTSKMLSIIKKLFGTMEARDTGHIRPLTNHSYKPQAIFTGTLNPLRGNDGDVTIRYRIPGFEPEQSISLAVLSIYLTNELYNAIRVEKGLSYSVDASVVQNENYGRFEIYADSEIENMQAITDLMLAEVDKLLIAPIPNDKFERVKRGLLLNYVYYFQDNAAIADAYSSAWLGMLTMDGFILPDELIEKVTPDDIHLIAEKYMAREKAIISHDYPTISYEQTYALIFILILLCVLYFRQHIKSYKKGEK